VLYTCKKKFKKELARENFEKYIKRLNNIFKLLKRYFMGCDKKPKSYIKKLNALERCSIFRSIKKNALKEQVIDEVELVSYTPKPFLEVLYNLTSDNKYDGLRIYFATFKDSEDDPGSQYIPKGQNEKFTLIFVPTTEKTKRIHVDDTFNCWIIHDNAVVTLNPHKAPNPKADTVSNWIRFYQKYRLPILEKDGQDVYDANFKETKSIWYGRKLIEKNDNDGLIDYLECLLTDAHPLDTVNIKFAGYSSHEKYTYQLTLIFGFHQQGDPADKNYYFTFAAKDISNLQEFELSGGNTDTGSPCPPNCNGTMLPL
jgi:hypothetical protein